MATVKSQIRKFLGLDDDSSGRDRNSRMSSMANIDTGRIGKSGFAYSGSGPASSARRRSGSRSPAAPSADLPASPLETIDYDSGTLNPVEFGPAIMGPSGVSTEQQAASGKTTYFGETPEDAVRMLQELAPEKFQDETAKPFWSRFKKGGKVKKKSSSPKVSSASKRADGCITKGKTRGRMV